MCSFLSNADIAYQIDRVIKRLYGESHFPENTMLGAVDFKEMGQGINLSISYSVSR
jgi:hypothetical protein